jgi:NADH dehydrogenase/NADH:ubiquinone oxidoreductase subunit G
MAKVKATIDGKEVSAAAGATILDAAEQAGIHIPSLCHRPELKPTGVCRVCVVEIEGQDRLVGSCHTPLAEGMVVHTASPKVLKARKTIVELLITSHTGSCVLDPNASACELHNLAAELDVGPPRFEVRSPRFYVPEAANPYVNRDLSKCILCRRCVGACDQVAQKSVLAIGYRGVGSKVVVDYDEPLTTQACKDCGVCIDYCPTGALSRPSVAS